MKSSFLERLFKKSSKQLRNEDELFDNKYGMKFAEALDLVKLHFKEQLPQFELTEEYNEKTGYWGLKYLYQTIMVFISCSRGYLECEVKSKEKDISLLDFEPRMKNAEVASEKNIRFTLNVINNLIERQH